MADYQQLLTIKEAAALVKLHPITLYEYIKTGKLKAVKFGRYYRITRTDLETFINEHRT